MTLLALCELIKIYIYVCTYVCCGISLISFIFFPLKFTFSCFNVYPWSITVRDHHAVLSKIYIPETFVEKLVLPPFIFGFFVHLFTVFNFLYTMVFFRNNIFPGFFFLPRHTTSTYCLFMISFYIHFTATLFKIFILYFCNFLKIQLILFFFLYIP